MPVKFDVFAFRLKFVRLRSLKIRRSSCSLRKSADSVQAFDSDRAPPHRRREQNFRQFFVDLFVNFFIVFIGNIADDFFQKVFDRNDSFEPPCSSTTNPKWFSFLHLPQNVFEPRRINDIERFFQNFFELEKRFDAADTA